MEAKLNNTIDKIVRLSGQNAEFGRELRRRLGVKVGAFSIADERLDQIYEYCIERIVRRQAEEFYSDFPIKALVSGLEDDFCRMEACRRKDCFGDFCLALYQQLECIASQLCVNQDLCSIAEHMWGYPAYVKVGKDETGKVIIPSIENRRQSDYSIATLVFPGENRQTGCLYAFEKSMMTLQSLYAMDKMRVIVYFLGYKAVMRNTDYDEYVAYTTLLSDIYQIRNTNHRGSASTPREQACLDRVLPHKSVYYFKFLGALAQFVELVTKGIPALPEMRQYAQGLPKKPVQKVVSPLKILGKIDLPDGGCKRNK